MIAGFGLVDALADEPVAQGDEGENEQEDAGGLVVEEPRRCHEVDVAGVQSRPLR